jgi:serine protease Do
LPSGFGLDLLKLRQAPEAKMKWLAILGLAFGLAFAPAASAEELPSVKYDGKQPVILHYRELTVTIDSAPGSDADSRVPVIKGRYGDREIFSIKVEDAEAREPLASARVIWLDHAAPFPQLVLTAFTFGAHCCTVTKIATMTAPDTWHVIDGQQLDGDEGYIFADLGHDGAAELISYDNDFLYAFASYADSFAPTRVAKLVGTDITDVSSDAKYRDFLRGKVRDMEAAARKDPNLWHSNGFLGAWVAAKSLVGEGDEAWARMLKSFDKKSDWSMQECTTGAEIDKCPQGKLRDLTFPQALKKLMTQGDYPLPKNAR